MDSLLPESTELPPTMKPLCGVKIKEEDVTYCGELETVESCLVDRTWSFSGGPAERREKMANKYPGRRFYTMYHGTRVNAAQSIINHGFRVSGGGMLGKGVYVSRDVNNASKYPLSETQTDQKVVLKLSVKVGKVKKIDRIDHPLRLTWHDHGYDSAWMPAGCATFQMNLEEDCVFDPHRIRVTDVVAGLPVHIDSLKKLIAAKH